MGRGVAELVELDSKERQALIKRLAASSFALEQPGEEAHRHDPDLVLEAVASHPRAMLQASEELRSDPVFALEVVRRNWRALEFLSQSVRSDRAVALAAARQHAGALEFTCGELRQDPDLMISLREGLKHHNAAKTIPAYEGECLRLVGFCNDWRLTDSRLRFSRVIPGQARVPEAASEEGPADGETGGGETALAGLAGGSSNDIPPGVMRHRLTAHLSQGYLSFQVLSCVHQFACRIYPTGGGQDGFFALTRNSHSGVTASWGGSGDGHGCNFYVVEMAGTTVNLYVDIHEGTSGSFGMPKVEVWYEVETGHLTGHLLALSQAADKQKPKTPKRAPRLCKLARDVPAAEELRVLVDPEASQQYNDLVMKARDMSKSNYEKRFYIRDLVGGKHLALLVGPTCDRVFGFCLYHVETSLGELQIEQVVAPESLRGILLGWLSAQAEAAGQAVTERQGETRADLKVPLPEVRRRVGMIQPDYPAFVVESSRGAKLWDGEEKKGAAYALLPKGVPVFGERRQGRVEVKWPVPDCWVDRQALVEVKADSTVNRRSLACGELFAVMHRVRLDVTGPDPKGQCIVSSHALCLDIVTHQIDRGLGLGPCRVMEGSFHTKPEGIGNWDKHWFVIFGNGTIADVTADQFDEVTQLWYPADSSRYALWVGDKHIPLADIEMQKMGKGIRWAANAFGWAPLRD